MQASVAANARPSAKSADHGAGGTMLQMALRGVPQVQEAGVYSSAGVFWLGAQTFDRTFAMSNGSAETLGELRLLTWQLAMLDH